MMTTVIIPMVFRNSHGLQNLPIAGSFVVFVGIEFRHGA